MTESKKLRVPAIDKAYHAGGKQIGWLVLTEPPYKEVLKNMRQSELIAEGGMCTTRAEFIDKYFKGDAEKEVWVVQFEFHGLDDKSHIPRSVAALEASMRTSNSPTNPLGTPSETIPFFDPKLEDEISIKGKKYRLMDGDESQNVEKGNLVFFGGKIIGRVESVHGRRSLYAEEIFITYIDTGCKKKVSIVKMVKDGYRFYYLDRWASSQPEAKADHNLKVLTSCKSDEHGTPHFLAKAAREVMGAIDLDPMSNIEAQKIIQAQNFHTKEDDGLTKPWVGRIWLNPAFSMADEAVAKLIGSYEVGVATEAILLIKAAPETKRHQSLAAYPFCELNKRVKYVAEGNKDQAPFSTLIFYLGSNFPKFREIFSKFGNIRLGQKQVDELENDRRNLLAKVAQLELQLAKKSEAGETDRRMDWLEDDICDRITATEIRLNAWNVDHDIPQFEILSRQRVQETVRLEELKSLQKRIDSINIGFFGDRQIERTVRPKLEEMEGWRPEFSVGKLVQAGDLAVEILRYSRIKDEWICIARIREKGESYSEVGQNFYLRIGELFADFIPYKFEDSPSYRLGSIRTTKELKSMFRGVKIPNTAISHSTEVVASDGSIWQAFKERTERCAIKWRCEVLPNGDSRIPRIAQKNDRLEAVTSSNLSY